MKLSIIKQDEGVFTVFTNTGFYAHQYAQKLTETGFKNISVEEIVIDLSPEKLFTLLKSLEVKNG